MSGFSKRLSLLILLVVFFTCNSFAQNHYASTVQVGVRAGADMSEVFFHPSVEQNFLFGATAGLTFRYIEERHFGLIAELNFSQRGWKEDFKESPYKYSRTLNYIQLPILAHIYFGRRGRFFINLGPEFGVFIGDNVRSNFDIKSYKDLPDFPNTNRMNSQLTEPVKGKFDYGIMAGLGGEFAIDSRNSPSVEGRFYYGIGNVFSAKRTSPFQTTNQMTISLALGYWFRIK